MGQLCLWTKEAAAPWGDAGTRRRAPPPCIRTQLHARPLTYSLYTLAHRVTLAPQLHALSRRVRTAAPAGRLPPPASLGVILRKLPASLAYFVNPCQLRPRYPVPRPRHTTLHVPSPT
jgi:hypothetical protein